MGLIHCKMVGVPITRTRQLTPEALNRRNHMKNRRSIKPSFVMLASLLFLSLSTFFLSKNLSPASQNAEQMSVQTFKSLDSSIQPSQASLQNFSLQGYIPPQQRKSLNENYMLAAYIPADYMVPQLSADTNTGSGTQEVSIALASVPAAAPVVQTPAPKPVVRYVNADKLNVRKGNNSGSDLVATLKRGDKVTFYQTSGDWAKIITWSDKEGYILSKFLVNSEKDVDKPKEAEKTKEIRLASRGEEEKTVSKPASAEALSLTDKIITYAKSLQGVKYVYGGYSLKGMDCSGFTKYVFSKYDISVPRSSYEYTGIGSKVSRTDLRAGDIVLFDTNGGKTDVSHVGIYIGGGNFIHASTSKGKVVIRNLADYAKNCKYMGARRVIE